jgi:hypothetical protein
MSVDDDDEEEEVALTERGRRALRAPDGLPADHLLYLEILARIGGCAGGKNVDDMTDELIAHFGSAEAAFTALKCGQVGFQKITDDDRSNAA